MNRQVGGVVQIRHSSNSDELNRLKFRNIRCSLDHRLSSTPLMQPRFELDDDIKIDDYVRVLSGQHKNKRGVVEWSEGTHL